MLVSVFLRHPMELEPQSERNSWACYWGRYKGGAADIVNLGFGKNVNQISNTCLVVNITDLQDLGCEGLENAVKSIIDPDIKFNVADYFRFRELWTLRIEKGQLCLRMSMVFLRTMRPWF